MITWSSLNQIPADFAGTAVTIGKFDAIHLGHQQLLAELLDTAEDASLAPVVLSFNAHPNTQLNPSAAPLPIIGSHQKQFLLAEAGVEALLSVEFDDEFAALSPAQFVEQYLVEGLHAEWELVGADFLFGSGGAGNVELLRELGAKHGFRVKVVSQVSVDGEVVSTTRIRALLDAGDVTAAASLLGRPHTTIGVIEHGLKIGRQIGFPTANMSREAEGYLPLDAVYAGWLYVGEDRYPAALSVGINDTFQAVPRLVEAHVIDETTLDLYDKIVTLEYVAFIRRAAQFDGLESLVEAINKDISTIRDILGITAPSE
jgi:riboflavin kinase/FMN adenylyltransferase